MRSKHAQLELYDVKQKVKQEMKQEVKQEVKQDVKQNVKKAETRIPGRSALVHRFLFRFDI